MMEDPAASNWHVDKRIPAALIITLGLAFFGQTITIVWWASAMTARVASLEQRVSGATEFSARITRVETILERVERKLDKLAP